MTSKTDLDKLMAELELLRVCIAGGNVCERQIGSMVNKVAALLDDAYGGPLESTLRSLHDLLRSMLAITVQKNRLSELATETCEV